MEKAKRLIADGAVTILANRPNFISAHVIGEGTDNDGIPDEHESEIYRDDPDNPLAISMWSCDCAWAQHSWGRTRVWKKYNGRSCFVPGTMITMADGSYKAIEDIVPGERVLTHEGVGRVLRRWDNEYDGEILRIQRVGSPFPIETTSDHKFILFHDEGLRWYNTVPLLRDKSRWAMEPISSASANDWVLNTYPVVERPFSLYVPDLDPHFIEDGDHTYCSVYSKTDERMVRWQDKREDSCPIFGSDIERFWSNVDRRQEEECWAWTGNIDISTNQPRFGSQGHVYGARRLAWLLERGYKPQGTRLAFSCDSQNCVNPYHMKFGKDKRKPLGKRVQTICPTVLSPSEELWTIVGYYLAEGSIEGNGAIVSWAFDKRERDLIDRLAEALKTLGLGTLQEYGYDDDSNRYRVKVSNKLLAKVLVRLCGTGSLTKRLAPELMIMDYSSQKSLLHRYWEGDGHHSNGHRAFSTASPILARQIALIGSRVGDVLPTIVKGKNGPGPQQRANGIEKEFTLYNVRLDQQFVQGRLRLEEGYYASRIRSIESYQYSGPVYDLEVDHQHTYAVEDTCVSNCSHVLATLWQSMRTPQDLSEQQPGYQVPRGQARPTEPGMKAPTWEEQQLQIPGLEAEGPQVTEPAIPPQPFEQKPTPKVPQRQQLYLWDLTARPGEETPAEFMPIPPEERTQTLQMPGAFSSVRPIISCEIPRFRIVEAEFNYSAANDFELAVQQELGQGRTPVVQILRPIDLEPRGGKMPMPGAVPFDLNSENTPVYAVMDLGFDPQTGERIRADTPPSGAPEHRGGSQTCPAGKRAIILSIDPFFKEVKLLVPLHLSGPLHPHALEGWTDYPSVKLLPNAEDPYRARY